MTQAPVNVTVTGAAGQIGYALLFRIASGQLLGQDVPVKLRLLEIPQAVKAAEGTAMELDDGAFPLLAGTDIFDDPKQAFEGTNIALLVGARPRSKGMERGDLLEANGGIFKPQGEAINAGAADDVKVLVVGNPANTNALIARSHAPDVPADRFTAMTRLDHNRALAQLSKKLGVPVTELKKLAIWGNHSATQYPSVQHAEVAGKRRRPSTRPGSRATSSPPSPSAARRSSKPAASPPPHRPRRPPSTTSTPGSTAPRPATGPPPAVVSDGSYGVPEGIISSFPVTAKNGKYEIVQGLEIDDFSRARIDASVAELVEERDTVQKLGLI